MIKTASSKYISLLTISVIAGFGPPVTVGMSSCFLGETFEFYEGVLMMLQMCCGFVVLFGAWAAVFLLRNFSWRKYCHAEDEKGPRKCNYLVCQLVDFAFIDDDYHVYRQRLRYLLHV